MDVRRRVTRKRPRPAAFGIGDVHAGAAGDAASVLAEDAPALPVREPMAVMQRPPAPKRRACYSFQFSFTRLPGRRQPASFTRAALGILVARRHTEAFDERQEPGVPANKVIKYMVFRELHADGNVHFYGMVLCERPYNTQGIQAALREHDHVFMSFGSDHQYFWTGIVYGAVPSVHKAAEEVDPEPYHSEGKTVREELADMPRGARVHDKDRTRAFLGLAALPPRRQERLRDAELADAIVEHGLRTKEEMLAFAREHKDDMPLLFKTVLRLGAKRSDDFMVWLWELHGLPPEPQQDRLHVLRAAMHTRPCACGGRWIPAANRLMDIQGIDSDSFRMAVLRALRLGRMKEVNVLIVGAPDAGKSFILKPLAKVFKSFIRRGQHETFPLQGIHGHDICLLQDVRYETFGLPWDDWLAWAEGEPIMVRLPRNHYSESKLYTGTAPLFATMADAFSYPIMEARQTGRCIPRENEQFRSRWNVITYPWPIPAAERDPTLHPCPHCAAQWYQASADMEATDFAAHAARPVVSVQRAHKSAGARPMHTAASAAVPPALPLTRRDELWARLSELMRWHTEGRLTATKFATAKAHLGL